MTCLSATLFAFRS